MVRSLVFVVVGMVVRLFRGFERKESLRICPVTSGIKFYQE